jgi:hypothetical protein
MKRLKTDAPKEFVPGETPDATKLSPLRQLIKDALDEAGAGAAGVVSGATEFFFVAPMPSILLHPNQVPGDPDDCHCT